MLIRLLNEVIAAAMVVLPKENRDVLHVLPVDDGSTQRVPSLLSGKQNFANLSRVDVPHLRHNLGHQRAIAIGLFYIEQHLPCIAVVVMDGDGEDFSTDAPRLLRKFHEREGKTAVFAERTRRTEKLSFYSALTMMQSP